MSRQSPTTSQAQVIHRPQPLRPRITGHTPCDLEFCNIGSDLHYYGHGAPGICSGYVRIPAWGPILGAQTMLSGIRLFWSLGVLVCDAYVFKVPLGSFKKVLWGCRSPGFGSSGPAEFRSRPLADLLVFGCSLCVFLGRFATSIFSHPSPPRTYYLGYWSP